MPKLYLKLRLKNGKIKLIKKPKKLQLWMLEKWLDDQYPDWYDYTIHRKEDLEREEE